MQIKSIKNLKNLSGKTIFLRADLNVPIKGGLVKDDYKIVMILPTIRFLLRYGCRIIIASHLDHGHSAEPAAKRLAKLLGIKVSFVSNYLGKKGEQVIKKMKNKDIVFLENLRFNPGEEKNDEKFAHSLAALANIYVNDAFAVSHRNHASVSAIKKYLPSYAGLLLEKEIINLEKVLKPKQPLISIIGGSKIETKIAVINNLAKKSLRVLIGGALANNFIAAHGFKIGKSLADKSSLKIAAQIINQHKNIILPIDVVVAKNLKGRGITVKPVAQVGNDEMILDIGPRTVKLFAGYIEKANTIIWNGPLGYFENDHFKHGTLAIGRMVAVRSTGQAFGVVGGGETVEAINQTKMANYIDWISTGGGAMLEFLSGKQMPGIKGVVK